MAIIISIAIGVIFTIIFIMILRKRDKKKSGVYKETLLFIVALMAVLIPLYSEINSHTRNLQAYLLDIQRISNYSYNNVTPEGEKENKKGTLLLLAINFISNEKSYNIEEFTNIVTLQNNSQVNHRIIGLKKFPYKQNGKPYILDIPKEMDLTFSKIISADNDNIKIIAMICEDKIEIDDIKSINLTINSSIFNKKNFLIDMKDKSKRVNIIPKYAVENRK